MDKYFPEIGEKLYLQQKTGSYYVDQVKTPWTVIGVDNKHITIQEAFCIFPQPRYFDTLPDKIIEDKSGKVKQLNWAPKKGVWQIDEYGTGYPKIAHFGNWEYFPYLD